MAFSKTRSITPFSRSSVSMVRSVTCFINWLNFWGVSLFRMLRTFLNSSWRRQDPTKKMQKFYLDIVGKIHFPTFVFIVSGSSTTHSRLEPGFQAFSAFCSLTSSIIGTFMMIFLGGGRRVPMFIGCAGRQEVNDKGWNTDILKT